MQWNATSDRRAQRQGRGIRVILGMGIALAVCGTTPSASLGRQTADAQGVQMLTNDIIVQARQLPAGSDIRLYEAQFAFLLDASQLECQRILEAMRGARDSEQMPDNGRLALVQLYRTLSVCGRGTGAGPGAQGMQAFGPMIDFAAGGGSDYTP